MNQFFKNRLDLNSAGNIITTIDSHTEGEATRLIVDGIGPVPGKTMLEKLSWFKSERDHTRSLLTKEPRGSKDILAALVTEPVSKEADFGLIYMDAKRYPFLCGHATIGAVVTLAKTGFLTLDGDALTIGVDTPSGRMNATVTLADKEIQSVAIDMVPSFVYRTGETVTVKGFGTIPVDIVCTGGFFAMVDAEKIGLSADLGNKETLIDLGMKIIDAANDQLEICHPLRPDVNTIDVTEFYDTGPDQDQGHDQGQDQDHDQGHHQGRGMVIYGESHADRSPCGTGTAAKLALLHHKGKIAMNEPYTNFSPLGTWFNAQIVGEETIGSYKAMVTRIQGMAYITGIHHFVIEDHDPFDQGYLM